MKYLIVIALFLSSLSGSAQEKTVSGIVSDKTGGLPGADIVVKGTSRSAQTDFDGNYSIKANPGEVLVFSFTGFKNQQVTVGSSNAININLVEDIVYINVYESPPIKNKPRRTVVAMVSLDSIAKYKKSYLLLVDGKEMKYRKFKKIKRETIESIYTLDPVTAAANLDKEKRMIVYVTTRKTPGKK